MRFKMYSSVFLVFIGVFLCYVASESVKLTGDGKGNSSLQSTSHPINKRDKLSSEADVPQMMGMLVRVKRRGISMSRSSSSSRSSSRSSSARSSSSSRHKSSHKKPVFPSITTKKSKKPFIGGSKTFPVKTIKHIGNIGSKSKPTIHGRTTRKSIIPISKLGAVTRLPLKKKIPSGTTTMNPRGKISTVKSPAGGPSVGGKPTKFSGKKNWLGKKPTQSPTYFRHGSSTTPGKGSILSFSGASLLKAVTVAIMVNLGMLYR